VARAGGRRQGALRGDDLVRTTTALQGANQLLLALLVEKESDVLVERHDLLLSGSGPAAGWCTF
jgi:hypothetical protein